MATNMTGTTMANWLPEQWSSLASITYRSNTVLPALMDRRWEPEIGVGRGDTVNIPLFSQNNSARNRGAGTGTFGEATALTFDAATEQQIQLVVNKLGYKGFSMPVEMSLQTMPNYQSLLTDGIGKALALFTDSELANDTTNGLDAFTSVLGVDNVDVTDDVVLSAIAVLDNAIADYESRYLVVSPSTYISLLKIERYANSLYGGSVGNLDGSKGTGYVGSIYNVDVYKSSNLQDGTAGKKNALFQKEAIAFAEQQSVKIVNDLNIEDGLLEQYVGYNVFGHVMVKDGFGNEVAGK